MRIRRKESNGILPHWFCNFKSIDVPERGKACRVTNKETGVWWQQGHTKQRQNGKDFIVTLTQQRCSFSIFYMTSIMLNVIALAFLILITTLRSKTYFLPCKNEETEALWLSMTCSWSTVSGLSDSIVRECVSTQFTVSVIFTVP